MSRLREIEQQVTAQMAAEGAEVLIGLLHVSDPVRRAAKCYAAMEYMRERQRGKTFRRLVPPATSRQRRSAARAAED